MKFFHPQIQVAREIVIDEPDAFFLHVITFCNLTNYCSDGYETPGFGPGNETRAEGLYKVNLKLCQQEALPDFPYITPVVHTIALGSIDFPGGEGEIEVTVLGSVLEGGGTAARSSDPPRSTIKTGGTGTVGTTGADNFSKPVNPNKL